MAVTGKGYPQRIEPLDTLARKEAGFLRWHLLRPLIQLLRVGATPDQLAWSIAVGIVVGVNPLLGSTTLVALAAAPALRLNLVATQLGNHLVYPLELLLFPVFLRLGIGLFHTPKLPLAPKALLAAVRFHPWDTTRLLWRWEWHALVIWIVFAAIAAPLLQRLFCPLLERALRKLHHEPVIKK